MDKETRNAFDEFPCYHWESRICSVFLRVDVMKSTDNYPAGVNQFAVAAYLTLMQRVQMARPDGIFVLDSKKTLQAIFAIMAMSYVTTWFTFGR